MLWPHVGKVLSEIFGGDTPIQPLGLGQIAARAIVVYVAGLLVVRVGKSRMIAHATPMDVIIGFLLGSILSRGITGTGSISGTIDAAVVLVALHWLFSKLAYSHHGLGNLIKGYSKILIRDGQVDWGAARSSHISEHDLVEQLRLHGNVEDFSRVRAAYKERSGDVSVVRCEREPKVVEIAVEAGVKTLRIEL